MSTCDELLAGYLAHAEAVAHNREDLHAWAFDEFVELLRNDPEAAWALTIELVARASDDATLAYVAAGPLEDLICEHPHVVIEWVEGRAAQDARFRKAIAGVWGWSRMPEEIRARLDVVIADEPRW
jgi:hypothetical protein